MTGTELIEAITYVTFYESCPKGVGSMGIARQVFAAAEGEN